jgi:UDP-N-acetyl-D-glucosamine dehydrogenase
MSLLEKLHDRSATLSVVGLGYVGLSLGIEFVKAGYRVIGIDTNEDKIKKLRAGVSYVMDVSSRDVQAAIESGTLLPTSDYSRIGESDSIHICVPTPLRAKTKDPNLTHIVESISEVRKHLRRNQLIVLESTTFPGTTSEVVLPVLEETGLRVGKDFFLAFSPERLDPANEHYHTGNIPKVVGGVTPECTRHATALYENCIARVVPVSSSDVAETVKLLENTFRSVNIALINEFALLCSKLDIDVWEVIEAASTKPFGFMPFYPGPGLGGHCIPVDTHYLSWKARVNGFHPKLIDTAVQVNEEMPKYVVARVLDALRSRGREMSGAKILIIGVAYKRNTDDLRESPALEIIRMLEKQGARVEFADPHVSDIQENGTSRSSRPLQESVLKDADCALILTDHAAVDYDLVAKHAATVVDTRNALKDFAGDHIRRL